ncbi:MAG: phosphatidylglycerol lysyltransferase domain-containing protein [Bacteroides sp.]|nr:phosphatidylglycerol lysyltransferase domain-containing protein [Bacteroides sp.]MCM1379103.1 phosphatidylglycerol lysyltransferase domain-containing protein [Bacteroides sp.]MCM1445801.1 phosphatidylglycerol lysyltransferase domain-containing protein [Prevotella sp.]
MKSATQTLLRRLQFKRIQPGDFADIAGFMRLSDSRTCDYTFGGIALWVNYFDYRIAVVGNTLFLCGGREDNLSVRAYALPVGDMAFEESVGLLRELNPDRDLWFSAIPEDRLHLFADFDADVSELGGQWSDYLYDIHRIASLEGGVMKKKRNHVNRFHLDHPDARLVDLDAGLTEPCRALLQRLGSDGTSTGEAEYEAVSTMLSHCGDYAPYFCGSVLLSADSVVGFTVGEPKGDTLHVHVEKCDHTIAGANEALTSLFAAEMLRRLPCLKFVNRQDDAGDPGLRASKESWQPLRLLPKFNVRIAPIY